MIYSTAMNFFKAAKSRDISTVELTEILISNGREIYLCFFEEQVGKVLSYHLGEVLSYQNTDSDEPITHKIAAGNVHPLSIGSRNDLVNTLKKNKDKSELTVGIEWEDIESNDYGKFLVLVTVSLKLNLMMNYEDSQFLPPLSSIKRRPSVSGSTSPTNFFNDNSFHKLVVRTMEYEGTSWNIVKRNLSKHTLEGEKVEFIDVSNHEGEMRPQIRFFTADCVEPYKIMESTFQKKLSAYRKHLK